MTQADPASADQALLLSALEAGAVTGVGAVEQRIDTHLSHVLLTRDHAFKLYRAVRMPFVDLRGVAARERACSGEITWNVGRSRKLYLRAAPLLRAGDGFALGPGPGAVVDWAVVMRRFDAALQFDQLAARGALSLAAIEDAAAMIAEAHAAAPHRQGGDLGAVIAGLRRTCADGAARSGVSLDWSAVLGRLAAEHARLAPTLLARAAAGKVRRVHGDLHLRNLCLYEGAATAFDAVSFDDDLAACDVLYDLAFLLMDLRHVGLGAHANAALNRYWDEAREDEAALDLMPFFMSLRAAVRLAVALQSANAQEAAAYGRLSSALIGPHAKKMVAVGGLSGAGKSRLARELAPFLPGPAGARILRSDVLRKRGLGLSAQAHAGEGAYTPAARSEVYRELVAAGLAVAGGASVILDATFQDASSREMAEAAFGPRLHPYWLEAPLETRLERVAGRAHDASDADVAVAAAQAPPADLSLRWRRLDALKPLAENCSLICADLGLPCGRG